MRCDVRGRKRTLDQLGMLTKSAGLQVSSVTPAQARSIVEPRPFRCAVDYQPLSRNVGQDGGLKRGWTLANAS